MHTPSPPLHLHVSTLARRRGHQRTATPWRRGRSSNDPGACSIIILFVPEPGGHWWAICGNVQTPTEQGALRETDTELQVVFSADTCALLIPD